MSEMINPAVFAEHHRLVTHRWRHKLRIRESFAGVDKPTHETVDVACRCAVSELSRVIRNEGYAVDSDESPIFIDQMESLKSDFDVLIDSSDMDIDELVREFDYRLNELFDLGDRRIQLRDGKLQKFAWIG